ncbi:hypothetical protein NG799_10640 [Laspinema sp. D1]|uniref:Uncharacterized protein n=1 Tax=Laspinema palackyanum D2a TaxID=2953684 RepID=A0ABT2MPW7_9CYAN|nr:hypothetical protein [Laspinema sp. D2b]MCT7966790.1 hypothetical protein [Laspinema sp. D2a]
MGGVSCWEPDALKSEWGEARGGEQGLSDRPESGFIWVTLLSDRHRDRSV